jgi:hypothetical protein
MFHGLRLDLLEKPCFPNSCSALLWYNAWPEQHVMTIWEERFLWIGKWVCCQRLPLEADGSHYRDSVRRIARWVGSAHAFSFFLGLGAATETRAAGGA